MITDELVDLLHDAIVRQAPSYLDVFEDVAYVEGDLDLRSIAEYILEQGEI